VNLSPRCLQHFDGEILWLKDLETAAPHSPSFLLQLVSSSKTAFPLWGRIGHSLSMVLSVVLLKVVKIFKWWSVVEGFRSLGVGPQRRLWDVDLLLLFFTFWLPWGKQLSYTMCSQPWCAALLQTQEQWNQLTMTKTSKTGSQNKTFFFLNLSKVFCYILQMFILSVLISCYISLTITVIAV
jgi:hypothetical protein